MYLELLKQKLIQSFSVVFYHLTQEMNWKKNRMLMLKIYGPQLSEQL